MGADSSARERIRGFIGAVERWIHAAGVLRILEAENATPTRPVLGWFLDEEDDDEDARRRAEALDISREPRVAFTDVKHAHAEAEAARAAVLAQSEAMLALLRNRGIDAEAVARVVVEVEGRRADEARRRWPRAKAALVVVAAPGEADGVPAEAQAAPGGARVAGKRSAAPGEATEKLVAALVKHHDFDGCGCLKWEPIGVRPLARLAGVGVASAKRFFSARFAKGWVEYRAVCLNRDRRAALLEWLAALNGEARFRERNVADPDDLAE